MYQALTSAITLSAFLGTCWEIPLTGISQKVREVALLSPL